MAIWQRERAIANHILLALCANLAAAAFFFSTSMHSFYYRPSLKYRYKSSEETHSPKSTMKHIRYFQARNVCAIGKGDSGSHRNVCNI